MGSTIETGAYQDKEYSEPSQRRFGLGDVMALIVATAIALFLLRTAYGWNLFHPDPSEPFGGQLVDLLPLAFGCFLIPLTMTLIFLSLRDGRIPKRDIMRSTGFITCVVVALSCVWPVLYLASRALKSLDPNVNMRMDGVYHNMFTELRSEAGPMTLGAWIALALSGRWRLGPGWIDRASCLVGFCYILLFAYGRLYFVLQPYLLK